MLTWLLEILNTLTTGSTLWHGIVFLLAALGEIGLPATCPLLESLLIFTGFQIVYQEDILAAIPFLLVAFTGRLCGVTAAYWISFRLGNTIVNKFGGRFGITQERIEQAKHKMKSFTIPAVVVARFTPGLNVLSSVVCGISRIDFKKFLVAVVIQLIVWETIFLSIGAIGSRLSDSPDAEFAVVLTLIWIGIAITGGIVMAVIAHRRIKKSQ